jgi:CheY-like chemotaxis protein
MKILLIEDDEEKAEMLFTFVCAEFPGSIVETAKSFNAGLRALIRPGAADVLLLDMSMPNFNATLDDPGGGAHEHFAGRDILAQMKLRAIDVPTIVITMFDLFGEQPNKMSYGQLEDELRKNFAPTFRGMVYYNSGQEGWKNSLKSLIELIRQKKNA